MLVMKLVSLELLAVKLYLMSSRSLNLFMIGVRARLFGLQGYTLSILHSVPNKMCY